jgi:hypothetical protein
LTKPHNNLEAAGRAATPNSNATLQILKGTRNDDPIAIARLLEKFSRKVDVHARNCFRRAQSGIERIRAAVETEYVRRLKLRSDAEAVEYLRPVVVGESQVEGLSVDDVKVFLQLKLIELAKRYRPGPRNFSAYAEEYIAQRAGTIAGRWVARFRRTYRAEIDAAVQQVLDRAFLDAVAGSRPGLRRFLEDYEQRLMSSKKTLKMAHALRAIMENPDLGKGSLSIRERTLANRIGMSPQAFNRTKFRLRERLFQAMPDPLRRRYLHRLVRSTSLSARKRR